MAEDWRDYERQVLRLFQATGFDCRADTLLKGVRATHQIDIEIEARAGGANYLWIAECKFWRTPVKKQQVLAFKGMLEDLGADHGFLLCEAGFQAGALQVAKSMNITLCDLAALGERFLRWQLDPTSETSRHYSCTAEAIDDNGNYSAAAKVSLVPRADRKVAKDILEIRISHGPIEWVIPREDAVRLVTVEGVLKVEITWDLPTLPGLSSDRKPERSLAYSWYRGDELVEEVSGRYHVLFRTLAGPVRATASVPIFK